MLIWISKKRFALKKVKRIYLINIQEKICHNTENFLKKHKYMRCSRRVRAAVAFVGGHKGTELPFVQINNGRQIPQSKHKHTALLLRKFNYKNNSDTVPRNYSEKTRKQFIAVKLIFRTAMTTQLHIKYLNYLKTIHTTAFYP